MKIRFLIFVCGTTSAIASVRPSQLLFPIEDDNSGSDFHSIGLNDFTTLRDEVAQLCKKPIRNISSEFNGSKIIRIHSAGDAAAAEIDCETIHLQLRGECRMARELIQSIMLSNPLISTSLGHTLDQETYNQARIRYLNAFNILATFFKLKCYNSFEKLYQVLSEFIDAESEAKKHFPQRQLDSQTKKLFYSLQDLAACEKKRRGIATQKAFIASDTTKDLLEALAIKTSVRISPAQAAMQDGIIQRDAARDLLKKLQEPTKESINSIERIFFMAFERFVASYHRGEDNGLEEAKITLDELKKIHELKRDRYEIEGDRYRLALEKFKEATKSSEAPAGEIQVLPSENTSDYSLGKFLREEATAEKNEASSEEISRTNATPLPKIERSGKRPLNESERAVKEHLSNSQHATQPESPAERITPLSLLQSAWKNCKKAGKGAYRGTKYVWSKLPF